MLGDNIKKIRKQRNMSINTLSKLSGVSLGYLSDLENNNSKNPTTEKIKAIADVLGVNAGELLDTDEKLNMAVNSINKIAELAEKGLSFEYKTNISHPSYMRNKNNLDSIATIFKNESFTKKEQDEIINFIKYVISKR